MLCVIPGVRYAVCAILGERYAVCAILGVRYAVCTILGVRYAVCTILGVRYAGRSSANRLFPQECQGQTRSTGRLETRKHPIHRDNSPPKI